MHWLLMAHPYGNKARWHSLSRQSSGNKQELEHLRTGGLIALIPYSMRFEAENPLGTRTLMQRRTPDIKLKRC